MEFGRFCGVAHVESYGNMGCSNSGTGVCAGTAQYAQHPSNIRIIALIIGDKNVVLWMQYVATFLGVQTYITEYKRYYELNI